MTKQVQRRRGTDTQHTSFTGAEGELSVNTTNKSVHVHDGATAGGIEAARADLGNVSDADLNSALTGNTLSSLTITSADINGGTIDGTVIGGTTPAAGNFTNITASGTVDGRDVAADGTKLDGIEAGADVTDAANVTSAGALMDSELTDIAAVKALDQGVATTDDPTFTNTQLAAIAETKGVTAVDVFVYDTSKDSDGGAWRKRTQGTSWYNETLNTATRGSRREFPAVAVIVAEATKVTIYDGDDPALPMWMVFNRGGSYPSAVILGRSVPNNTSVASLNGVLAVGIGTSGYGEALSVINFVSDSAVMHTSASSWRNGQDISGRNTPTTLTVDSSVGNIISLIVNDVAMTVLPDAPIDPATGLPVPTIAVATNGGVSVIKDDGTVVDLTYTYSTNNSAFDIDIDTTGRISWGSRDINSAGTYIFVEKTIPVADKTTAPDILYTPKNVSGGSLRFNSLAGPYITAKTSKAIGSGGLGLTHLAENPTTPANGMVAYTTSTYNTGWMNGDIKGAFLSDTDDTDLVGSGELVTNGTFDTDVSGWTLIQIGGSSATLTQSSGKALITLNGSYDVGMYQAFTTVVGKTYTLVQTMGLVTAFNANATGRVSTFIGTAINGSQNAQQEVFGIDGVTVNLTFTATATTTYVTIRSAGSGNTTGAFTVDNISVKLADADRSVNNNGLIVNGTVTKNPVATGADLVAYSGFSASNYLEQPYNSALDFGTGDFCVMGWVKANASGVNRAIVDRSAFSGSYSGAAWRLRLLSGGNFAIQATDDGYATSDLLNSAKLGYEVGNWVFFVAGRTGNNLFISVNGDANETAAISAAAGGLSNSSAILSVGKNPSGDTLPDASLALLRISATAPTAEQIAKIYNDEKVLFQDNAAATLYGASDAVTALAHDDEFGLLHVGTSAGRSVFQGLRRVSNTTTAVGNAISASNGLVVEE